MSRIGRMPIAVPAGVTVSVAEGNVVTVKGPKGELTRALSAEMTINQEGNVITVTRPSDEKEDRALHGLTRTLVGNMVTGVTTGFSKTLEVNGVGYRVQKQGNQLVMNIGFSHPVLVKAVPGITLSCEKTTIKVEGIDKELVGQFAAKVRDIKPVEPYHAYGISYSDEVIVRKEVKSGKK